MLPTMGCPLVRRAESTKYELVIDLKAAKAFGLWLEHRFVLGRRVHRQIGRLLALEDAIDVAGHRPDGSFWHFETRAIAGGNWLGLRGVG